jgi:hypothetical protein
MAEVTLIYEINVYERPGHLRDRIRLAILRSLPELGIVKSAPAYTRCSVWLYGGLLSDDQDYTSCAVRLLGPTAECEADAFSANLTKTLESAGIDVHSETTADD